jgi:membrane protein DedA with SNARE-associated domain/rhodanese-related sulfurtransferase
MELITDILHRHGTLVVFGVIFAEQLGLPLPALPLLMAAGVLIGTGHLTWPGVLAAATVAALMADSLWYVAGKWRGRSVLTVLCRIAIEPDACIRRTETFFLKHGAPSLVVGKLIPGLSTIAPPLAGIMGLSVSAFLLYDSLGIIVWVGSSLGLGYVFSDQIEHTLTYAQQVTSAVTFMLVSVVVGYMLYKAVTRHRLRLMPRITVEELLHKLQGEMTPLLIDVRGREAIEAEAESGLPGALHMPLEELERRHATIPRGRDLVLYCACPGDVSSSLAALRLQRLGFEQVWVLRGGLSAWRARERQELSSNTIPLMPSAT